MDDTAWMVVIGGVAAVLHSVTTGANLMVNCWGPPVGAKAVSYERAVILGLICQCAGVLAFGPETYPIFESYLDKWSRLEPYPRLTAYALMWTIITPFLWQTLAIWQAVPVPPFLGAVASTVGTILVFPGSSGLVLWKYTSSLPYLSGLAIVIAATMTAPTFSIILCATFYVWLRNWLMRGEDSLHKMLWVLPFGACTVSGVCGFLLMYNIGSPQGTHAFSTTPQGACIILSAVGSAACIGMCLGVPHVSRRWRLREPAPVKRMSRLGLDEATIQELATEDVTQDMKGRLQWVRNMLLRPDMAAAVRSDETLLRIHATAEQFEAVPESFLAPFQIILSAFLSLAYGANNGQVTMGMFAALRHISRFGVVPESVDMDIGLRCVMAAGMAIGTILWGSRLAPVTGVQLAKMTPFRSYVVMVYTAGSMSCFSTVNQKQDTMTYILVFSVIAVGLAEGTSHVNWSLLRTILLWWLVGFGVVLMLTAAFLAQGVYAPSLA